MADPTPSRPEPTANGTLGKTPLVNLLVYVHERKLTGMLELVAPDRRSAIVTFVSGRPAKVRTSDAVAHLGRVLFETGKITEAQLTRSLADLAKEKASGQRLQGELLAAQGAIDDATLDRGLEEQVLRKLKHIAVMPSDSAYGYYDAYDGLAKWGRPMLGFDPQPMLWPLLREGPPREHVKAALAKLGRAPLRLKAEATRLGLSDAESAALAVMRSRPMATSEMAKVCGVDEATGELLAYLLLITKLVDVLPAPLASEAVERAASPLPAAPAPLAPPAAPTALPAPLTATRPPPQPVAETPSAAPPPAASRAAAGSTVPPRRTPVPGGSTAPPPVTLSAELATRWKEITARAASIDRTDYFSMLDLARDATVEEVESAFFALAKVWHPDRLPAALTPVRDACARVFARMSEARSALADADERAAYMRLLSEGSGSPEAQDAVARVIEAATQFQKAEICLKRNDLVQAEELCRQATALDDSQADYLAMLAWLLALRPDGQSPEATTKSIRMLDKAVSKNARCERAYYWRGALHKRLGNGDSALRDFRKSAELNPRNIDAAREVRLATLRSGGQVSSGKRDSSPPPPAAQEANKGGGLFGRLFKK